MIHPSVDILALHSDRFVEEAIAVGIRKDVALNDYRCFYRTGVKPPEYAGADIPEVVNEVKEGGTIKFLLGIEGGLETESVILPMESKTGRLSYSLCVSSQVGCAMGCEFCETAQMGLLRNLSCSQIIAQWYVAKHIFGYEIDNMVFMGMGEPMDNLDAVLNAIEVLTDRNGPEIAPSNISVSTVGRCAGIRQLTEFVSRDGFRRLKLAVSINAPNDEIRSSIMPINRAEPMSALMDAMLEWPDTGARIFIEYVLIPGVNDSIEHADQLCEYLSPLDCKVNVIPYNPRSNSPWPSPDEETVKTFQDRIHSHGVFVTRRRTLGRDVMAACGQLGNTSMRRKSASADLPMARSTAIS